MSEVFLEELVKNYSGYFKETYDQDRYPNQSIESCQALFEMCVDMDPDFIIDIGTNFGASTFSFAHALKTMGKPLSLLTTIDLSHGHWRERTPNIQHDLLKKENLDMRQIKTVESDFSLLDPSDFLKEGKGVVFYDIHDNDQQTFSDKLLQNWVPRLKEALVIVHDCSLVPESYVLRTGYTNYTMTKLQHFSGKFFAGFGECAPIIQWLNDKKIDVSSVPLTSLIYFKVNND